MRESEERRAFQAGEQHKQRPECHDCSVLDEKRCELCHCYFPSLSAWPVTTDRKFPGKGTKNFLSVLSFLGFYLLAPS